MEEDLDSLCLKECILLKELELVKIKIEYVRKYSLPEKQKVASTPFLATSKVEPSPVQTATGKDLSTPLIAVDLLKIQNEVQTSKTLENLSDLNLRPNGGIQIPEKTNEQSLARLNSHMDIQNPTKNYYVVYNGPNPGIYNNWGIANKAVSGISGVSHKKFKSFQEAKASANLYSTEMMKPPLELINSADALKPTYQQALKKITTTSNKVVLGKVKSDNLIINFEEDSGETIFDSFSYFYELGRKATEKEFVDYRFYTTDKANISYFNFFPNADPEMVFEAYVNGLVNLIYPSKNLLEISSFPKSFRDTVKNFRKKCVKDSDKEIFIKVQSTLPFWEEYNDELVLPFHYIQLGIVKERIYQPSAPMKVTLEKEDLEKVTLQKHINILEKISNIKNTDKIKINLYSGTCLVTSMTHAPMSKDDQQLLSSCIKKLACGKEIFGKHIPAFCKAVDRIIKDDKFVCLLCAKEVTSDKGKGILSSAESSEEMADKEK